MCIIAVSSSDKNLLSSNQIQKSCDTINNLGLRYSSALEFHLNGRGGGGDDECCAVFENKTEAL